MSRFSLPCPPGPWMDAAGRPLHGPTAFLADDQQPVAPSTLAAMHEEARARLRLVPYAEAARRHGHDVVSRLVAQGTVGLVDSDRDGETLISLTAIENALRPSAEDSATDEVLWPGGRKAWGQPERKPR